MSKLRIDNLDEDTSIADLIDLFGKQGEIQKAAIYWGDGPPHAFVTLDYGSAAGAMQFWNGRTWRGKRLRVCHANMPRRYRFWDRE